MNNYYIYEHLYHTKNQSGQQLDVSATVIFCESENIHERELQSEINEFYQKHNQTDKIFVLGGKYLANKLEEIFVSKQEETFKNIPKAHMEFLKKNIHVYYFDELGNLTQINLKCPFIGKDDIFPEMFNDGLVQIFKERGGLIESKGSHHFVFPSGKHCNKFLRTGNILLYSSEIYFIAFRLLKYLKEQHLQIFCDTSSINTLAFALQDLKRRIIGVQYLMKSVESFTSYEGLYKGNAKYLASSLILISSSTSANIINRIIEAHRLVKREDMAILYFLGDDKSYYENKGQIICNLTKTIINPNGIKFYETFSNRDCVYCRSGSHAVEVKGDVFLLEKPKINRIILSKTDTTKKLSNFIQEFSSINKTTRNVLKVNYKEHSKPESQYEIYIDLYEIIHRILNSKADYPNFRKKLLDYINQYIPSNTKYLIHLLDNGSIELSNLVFEKIKKNYTKQKAPIILSQDAIDKIPEDVDGSAVIIASCISDGKNILYLSRALRKFDKLRLVYFTGLIRTKDKETVDFLKGNVKQGIYGKDTNSFIEVESMFCSNAVKNTSWVEELEFMRKLENFAEEKIKNPHEIIYYIQKRTKIIEESLSDKNKGLSNNLFHPSLCGAKEELILRKNFAFLDYLDYHHNVSQADTYFIISSIINSLRHCKELDKSLAQSEYVRAIIDPGNFNRFNDGIIQASILRSAYRSELAYNIDDNISSEMYSILETIIKYHNNEQGEALLEFLYALANQKLSLKQEHLSSLCLLIEENIKDPVALGYCAYITSRVLVIEKSLREENESLKKELHTLKDSISEIITPELSTPVEEN